MGAVASAAIGAAEIAAGIALTATGNAAVGVPLIVAGAGTTISGAAAALAGTPTAPAGLSRGTTTIRAADSPWRLIYGKTRVGGVWRYIGTSGNDHKYFHIIIVLACHQCESIGAMWRNGEQVTDEDGVPLSKWGSDRFLVVKRLGTDDQTAVTELIDAVPDDWTTDHRLRGMTYVYVRVKYSLEHLPDGIGELTFDVEGNARVYDPRTDTYGYSQNPALCAADYITNSRYGMGRSYDDLDADDLVASANACEEAVAVTSDSSPVGSPATFTQPRFICNGFMDLNQTHSQVLGALGDAMAGKIIPSGPQWRVLAGIWRAPAVTINQNHCRAGLNISAKREGSDVFNTIKGTFIGAETNYEVTDYAPVTAQTWLDEDRGVEIDGSRDFAFVDDHNTVRRVAKIVLSQTRRQLSVDWPGTLACYRLRPGDTVSVDFSRYGWSSKTFEVGPLTFSIEPDANGINRLVVDASLGETDSGVYSWSTDDEEPPPVPRTTSLPDPSVVVSPDTCNVDTGSAYAFTRADGSWVSRLYVTWTDPNSIFITDGGTFQTGYRKTSEASWSPGPTVGGDQLSAYIEGVQDGTSYRARVRSVNMVGGTGDWVESADITVQGKVSATLDVDADSFRILRQADGTREFRWTLTSPPADLDGYKIRYVSGTGGTWSTMTDLFSGLIQASPWETNQLPAGTYTFGIKAFDRSGNESSTARIIEAEIGDPRLRNVLLSLDEGGLGWPGTKTDCFVDPEGYLEASSDGSWADLSGTTWGDLSGTTWANVLPKLSPITYETDVIDLGFEATFTPLVNVDVVGTATITMRYSLDPFGSPLPSYGSIAQITARYIQIKASVAGSSPIIRAMTINLDAELKSDEYNDLVTSGSTGTPAGFEHLGTGHFKVESRGQLSNITTVRMAIQGTSGGITWTIADKATTITGGTNPAAEIYLFDSSGSAVDATVDVELRGLAA